MEHRATGYSANMMMLGMEVFQPIDILMRTAGEHFRDEDPAGYVQHLCQVLQGNTIVVVTSFFVKVKHKEERFFVK